MTLVLPLSPLHIPQLLLGHLPPSQAYPWERLGAPPASAMSIGLAHLWPLRGRAWVAMRGPRVMGVVACTHRSHHTWEVLGLCAQEEGAAAALLQEAARHLALAGGERLLLRLPAEAPLLAAAHRAGFLVVAYEHLYKGQAWKAPAPSTLLALGEEHQQQAFRLFLSASPAAVRALQGPTLGQWRSALTSQCPSRELGLWEEGELLAWARLSLAPQGVVATALVHPRAGARAPEVVAALTVFAGPRPLYMLVPSHQQTIIAALESLQWPLVGRFISLVRPLAQAAVAAPAASLETIRGRVAVN
jgi:hypothetical protein